LVTGSWIHQLADCQLTGLSAQGLDNSDLHGKNAAAILRVFPGKPVGMGTIFAG